MSTKGGDPRGGVVLVVAVVGVAAAAFTLSRGADIDADTDPPPGRGSLQAAPGSSPVQASRPTPERRSDSGDDAHVDPWLLPDERPPPPEADSLSDEWDTLSPDERVEAQRKRFTRAIRAANRGLDVPANLLAAQDALSAMRPELYATDEGRREHRGYEAELDRLEERSRTSKEGRTR